jgi:glycosyltransferase involved in cell wall biosynthesis
MKVCMITSFPPAKDVVGDVTYNLVKSLREIGVSVSVITHRMGAKEERDFHQIITRKKSKRGIYQIFREIGSIMVARDEAREVADLIEQIRPDVVHAQYEPGLYSLFFLPQLFKMLNGRYKTVLTLHGRDYFPLNLFHKNLLYPLPNRIIVHNSTHRDLLPEDFRKKVSVIPMGISRIRGKVDRKFLDNFMFFGYASPYKGLEFLIEAFSRLSKEYDKTKLLIYSPVNPIHSAEDDYREKIKKMIKDKNLGDRIIFVSSYTSRGKLPSIKAQTAVFPYKKSYSAGQSAALLDCIASGKAVIVTRVPGIFERIQDGENGLIIEPEDSQQLYEAMRKLLVEPKLVERMAKNNLKLSRRLSWGNIARQTLNLYKK